MPETVLSSEGTSADEKIPAKERSETTNESANFQDPIPRKKSNFLGSTHQHAFSTPAQAEYWLNIYKTAGYEGTHRFDPSLQWTEQEEKRLVRKVRPMDFVWPRPTLTACRLIFVSCAGNG